MFNSQETLGWEGWKGRVLTSTCICTNDCPVKRKSMKGFFFFFLFFYHTCISSSVLLSLSVSLSLSERRQACLFVKIYPTTFYHKHNRSFIGFICFLVFKYCFDPREEMFVLFDLEKHLRASLASI